MGMACPSDYRTLFVHFLHQGMCPMPHYTALHYTELRQITFLAARHVPYATPSGELRLLVRDQMPRDLTGPFVSQPVYVWPGGHVKYVRLLVRVQMPNCPHPETQLVLLFLTQHLAIKCQICETPSQEIGMELDAKQGDFDEDPSQKIFDNGFCLICNIYYVFLDYASKVLCESFKSISDCSLRREDERFRSLV